MIKKNKKLKRIDFDQRLKEINLVIDLMKDKKSVKQMKEQVLNNPLGVFTCTTFKNNGKRLRLMKRKLRQEITRESTPSGRLRHGAFQTPRRSVDQKALPPITERKAKKSAQRPQPFI